jgi:hypothetical protein
VRQPYTPGRAVPETVDALRSWVQQEFDRISNGFAADRDEIGDSTIATNGLTGMLLWVNKGSGPVAVRVSLGAADSGGAGYRMLRVEN